MEPRERCEDGGNDGPRGGVGARESPQPPPSTMDEQSNFCDPRALFPGASDCSRRARGEQTRSVARVPREKGRRERVDSPERRRRGKEEEEEAVENEEIVTAKKKLAAIV